MLAEGHTGSSAAACRSKLSCCCVTGRGLAAGVGDQGLESEPTGKSRKVKKTQFCKMPSASSVLCRAPRAPSSYCHYGLCYRQKP